MSTTSARTHLEDTVKVYVEAERERVGVDLTTLVHELDADGADHALGGRAHRLGVHAGLLIRGRKCNARSGHYDLWVATSAMK